LRCELFGVGLEIVDAKKGKKNNKNKKMLKRVEHKFFKVPRIDPKNLNNQIQISNIIFKIRWPFPVYV
jgi:hypothetical protein